MLKNQAGTDAGIIWRALNKKKKSLSIKQLKKTTKLVDKDLYMGFGWLMRENKICFLKEKDELYVKLN